MTDDAGFEALLQHLRDTRGFDFTGYKRTSLMRRVQRQMQSVGIASYEDYLDHLQVDPDEFTALFNTILINVTSFFRDADAWAYMRDEMVPELLARKSTDTIRVWSAGCASGEEAYSLAMVLADALGPDEFRERVKVYATDVDEEALAYARHATYTDREVEGLPPEVLERYFEADDQRFVFRKDLRRSVIFGRNDLVQDAPISRIDLLTCRNTLMYFNVETQARILQRLHFALNERGTLFLGKAETLLSHAASFEPLELKRRFFRKVSTQPGPQRGLLIADTSGNGRSGDGGPAPQLVAEALVASPVAQVVLDAGHRVTLTNQRADALFGIAERDRGRLFHDLELSYRPVELRSSIAQAVESRRPVWIQDVEWPRPGVESIWLDIQIAPILDQDAGLHGVTLSFLDITRVRQLARELEQANRQLETAYEELQSTNEELETTNEELQSTIEELETTNEELQSTNEELETMNEELQSINDELQTSNEDLRERTTELSDLNHFMQSILTSLRAGVAVVDRDMRILVWNRRAEDLWGLRQEEVVGDHLLNLDIGLPVEQLKPLVRTALSDGKGPKPPELVLDATNRRGRPVTVRVTGTPLVGPDQDVSGVILVIDTHDGADG